MARFVDFDDKTRSVDFGVIYEQNTSLIPLEDQGWVLYCPKQDLLQWIGLNLCLLSQTSRPGDLALESHQNDTHAPMTMAFYIPYEQNTSFPIKYSQYEWWSGTGQLWWGVQMLDPSPAAVVMLSSRYDQPLMVLLPFFGSVTGSVSYV
jgi:hypothetical protein